MLSKYLLCSLLVISDLAIAASPKTKPRQIPALAGSLRAEKKENSETQTPQNPDHNTLRLIAGAGIQNVYLPSIGIEALGTWESLQIGGEFGFFQLSRSVFSGSTSFFGLSGRWIMSRNKPFFLGLSLGSRNITITTKADLSYTDSTTGSSTATSIAWTRKVSQTILYPKAGLMWSDGNSAVAVALGLVMPLGSKASISGNPAYAAGITDKDYQTTADQKLREVTKTTNAVLPGLEIKYLRFLM